MIGSEWVDISAGLSVGIIGLVLGVAIVASLRRARTSSPTRGEPPRGAGGAGMLS
jgi:hypothetical protein